MFYSIKKSSKTRKEAAVKALDAISDMEEQLKKDEELMNQQKAAADVFVRPSQTSGSIQKFVKFFYCSFSAHCNAWCADTAYQTIS